MQKKSETLRQRDKAQKDLLELKKRQQGILPSCEEAERRPTRTPETFKEKKDNFFYHHKLGFYAAVLAVVVLAFLIIDAVTTVKYDTSVVLFTHERYYENQVEAIASFLEEYGEDTDKNGEIRVSVYDCSYDKSGSGYQFQLDQRSRVQARITAGNAMLFLLDESALNDLKENLEYELFPEENRVNVTPLIKQIEGTTFTQKNLYLCLRKIEGSTADGKKNEYNDAKELLEKVKNELK